MRRVLRTLPMKKNIIILIALVAIVAAWLLTGFFDSAPDTDGGAEINQGASPELPVSGQAPDTANASPDQEQNDAAERLEAERLEAERLEAENAEKRRTILEQGELLFRGYYYEEALELLGGNRSLENQETKALEGKIAEAMSSLVRFDGEIKHIFFHSLILYPEHLFRDLSRPTGGYNEGFAYQSELIKMLPQLLERGYVLYNINDIFNKDENGNMTQRGIFLPPGKIPLVLSIDDPTYHYGVGFANRMILDENGDLATEVITPTGETIVTYDGDVQLVVDSFVAEHPEFSFRGHKGIIAATGYMGIFGYDLMTEESRDDAVAVSDKLKSNGWIFANHSYTHNRTGYWGPESNPANIRSDVRRWRERMEPIIGGTNVFIAPFGYTLRGEGMQVILDNGYDIYCNVDFNQRITVHPAYALMGRIEIGGYSLVRYSNTLTRDFFDVSSVIDAHRPPVLSG